MARPRVREKILDAAYSLLQSEGASAMTTRHIAVCAGTTEASVFNNFGDKARLLYALIGERLPEVQAVKSAINAELQGDITVWLQSVYEHAELFYSAIIPLTAPLWGREQLVDSAMASERHPLHGLVMARLLEFQRDGILAPRLDAKVLAIILLGAALHSSFNVVAHGSVALNDKVAERSERIVASLLPLFATAN
ncbi:TetR/AcrR family transcriptional regulator [Zhongshania aliphaticivorans]|uniref:TetR/AcrR family transcriptional regulator n=1 Tax=Zhongshania aliphaticivorans TaxID=1470434 RepID=UPI0012E62B34|nr:helix-turn-helix domain-containing protein [Zhongshania aliphaticivorans]CAA0102579.1 Nucleoid occlusion factor SlmA [Zhongshania aliphaticivorans]